jgi:hypothetical protein
MSTKGTMRVCVFCGDGRYAAIEGEAQLGGSALEIRKRSLLIS